MASFREIEALPYSEAEKLDTTTLCVAALEMFANPDKPFMRWIEENRKQAFVTFQMCKRMLLEEQSIHSNCQVII
jgi:hypothetical protein